jgi:hypothetical protein
VKYVLRYNETVIKVQKLNWKQYHGRVEHESQSIKDAYVEDFDETQMVLDIKVIDQN